MRCLKVIPLTTCIMSYIYNLLVHVLEILKNSHGIEIHDIYDIIFSFSDCVGHATEAYLDIH